MSLLHDAFLKSVTFLENGNSTGTGFFIGVNTGRVNEKGSPLYQIFLVTNRHVIDEIKPTLVHLDTKTGIKVASILPEDKAWFFPSDKGLDLAMTIISPRVLEEIEAEVIFIAEEDILKTESEILEKINVGQEVYLLGFPLGLKGIKKNFPLARQGVIARNDEELLSQNQIYLDINNFPGNSGGPIIVKPSAVHLQSRKPFKKNMLLAIVSQYIAYKKTLYDNSTNPPVPKMIIEENSGIAIAIPMSVALSEIHKWIKRQRKPAEEKGLKPKPADSDTEK